VDLGLSPEWNGTSGGGTQDMGSKSRHRTRGTVPFSSGLSPLESFRYRRQTAQPCEAAGAGHTLAGRLCSSRSATPQGVRGSRFTARHDLGERPVRWCVLSGVTDEPLSEFRSRSDHAIDRRARGLLVAIVIALIALVTLIVLLAARTSPSASSSFRELSRSHADKSYGR
jgi:hypothetical protein